MNYVIVNKETKVIQWFGPDMILQSNGYPFFTESKLAFPTEVCDYYEVKDIPEEVERYKWKYDPDNGFSINENYIEPDPYMFVPENVLTAILEKYTLELIEGGLL